MLYTRKGDTGTTTAFGCDQQRISKTSELPEALGALDELNAAVGVAKAQAKSAHSWATDWRDIATTLHEVQESLFIIQAEVAGAEKHLAQDAVAGVEMRINTIEKQIPKLTGFSIAGGTPLSSSLDLARTVARRAERRVLEVHEKNIRELPPQTLAYLNRLSSLLFALARLANHVEGVAEENPRY